MHSRELILNLSFNLKIDCYPYAIFAGMYGHEKITNPIYFKSKTSYMIIVTDCPILWQSKLQIETAFSTIETEVIALAHSCRELLPVRDMVASHGDTVSLPKDLTTMYASIHENNSVVFILAETLASKYIL